MEPNAILQKSLRRRAPLPFSNARHDEALCGWELMLKAKVWRERAAPPFAKPQRKIELVQSQRGR